MVLPEGLRNQVVYKCYVSNIVNTVIEKTDSLPTMVSYKGIVYNTHYVKGWQNINNTGTGQTSLIPHYEILLVKTDTYKDSASFVKDGNFTVSLPEGYTELDWDTFWGYT